MLTVSPETVCFLIIKAREFSAKVPGDGLERGGNPADDDERAALLQSSEDTTGEEIDGVLNSLNQEERAEILALLWLGRGDFAAEQWPDAVAEAARQPERQRTASLLAIPLLGGYLEEGLARLGYRCEETERQHL